MDSSDFAERTHDHLNRYITLADRKASILLSGQLAFLGLFANVVNAGWQTSALCFKLTAAFTVVFGLTTAFFGGRVIYPRTPDTDDGLMLWSSILTRSIDDYVDEISHLSDDDALEAISKENYMLASVADNKYENLRITLILTGITVFLALLSIILLLT